MTESQHQQRAKETFAGFVGGAVQVLVGQPFDLVKVRMQTGQFSTVSDAFFQTLKKEGPLAFYKGTTAPLLGVGACVSIQFYAFHETKRQILKLRGALPSSPLTGTEIYACGAMAGIANTFIACPVEHMRIALQTQRTGHYHGPYAFAQEVVKLHGIKALYRGFTVTLLREAQAYGVWFLAFEMMLRAEQSRINVARHDLPAWKLAVAGALAGEALWLSSYPLDVVKSQVQSDGFGTQRQYNGALDAMRKTWQLRGWRGFVTGLSPTLLRALPASASTFAAVELTMRALS